MSFSFACITWFPQICTRPDVYCSVVDYLHRLQELLPRCDLPLAFIPSFTLSLSLFLSSTRLPLVLHLLENKARIFAFKMMILHSSSAFNAADKRSPTITFIFARFVPYRSLSIFVFFSNATVQSSVLFSDYFRKPASSSVSLPVLPLRATFPFDSTCTP